MKNIYFLITFLVISLTNLVFAAAPPNDNCLGATVFPAIPTTGACSNLTNQSTNNATASNVTPTGACSSNTGTADDDVWFKFQATATSIMLSASFDSGGSDIVWQVFSGACGSSMTSIFCSDFYDSGFTLTGLTVNNWYYIKMYSYYSGETSQYDICLKTPPPPPANDNCTGATALTINAFGSCTSQTAGSVNSATASSQANTCSGTADDDVWYKFQATSTAHSFQLTSVAGSDYDMYHSVYSGTCASIGTPITCNDADLSNLSGLTIGNWYYVRVYTYTSSTGQTSTFNACVQSPPSCPASLGSGNVNVASLPYSATNQSPTGDEITAANVVTCGDSYYFGDRDKVYIFTPTSSGNVTINISTATNYVGATLFNGCPFSGTCVDFVQSYATGTKGFCAPVVSGNTYYLVVDSDNGTTGFNFDVTISAIFSGQPNDLPCNATTLFNGTSTAGDLDCSSGTSEPAVPSCWTTGNVNSIWYKFQATSIQMYIQTTLTTASSTQIAVYSGACGAGMTLVGCNQDAGSTGCAGVSTQNSLLDLPALTIGTWYYVRVDGEYNTTGTFNVILNDGLSSTTNDPLLGQDCGSPLPVCTNVVNVPNPSYAGTGNICDFTGTNNCTSGELNSVWYTFQVGVSGNLNFVIRPNDAPSSNAITGTETDYDWVLWKKTASDGTVVNTCSTLDAATPISCNFGSIGVTGITPGGTTPSPYTGSLDIYFEPTLAVTAGETYIFVVQNYETTSSGFNLDFSASSAGVIDNTPNTIYWNGATSNNFNTTTNYSGCAVVPACNINVVVNNLGFQPNLNATQGYTTNSNLTIGGPFYHVQDLTINAGATLTLAAGVTLEICGNFTNYGNLICSPTSNVIFVNGATAAQSITGNFITTNKFGNLIVNKTSSNVILNNNITIGGSFTTASTTSVLNSNNKYIKLAGHFNNFAGNTTFTNTGTVGTLEFNGTGSQTYYQGNAQLDLNYVVINNTAAIGSGVNLNGTIAALTLPVVPLRNGTDMFIKATTGTLTLTAGTITTGGATGTSITGNRVHVLNLTPSSVSNGSATSFVDGNLRRYANDPGDYYWPVGNVAKGYQLARTNFSAMNNSMHYIDCRFDPWLTSYTIGSSECGKIYDQVSMNNGMWTFIPDGGTCTYDATLYPTNVTNILGTAWTILKRPHTTVADATGWVLNGTCATSTSSAITRTGMTNFSFMGVDQGIVSTPIELLYFTGKNEGAINKLEWETAAERDNDYFIIEKSTDGIKFSELEKIEGAGNSSTTNYYTVNDSKPNDGINYYRLKQVDFNGETSTHNTIMIENKLSDVLVGSIYPNPTNESSSVQFYSPSKGDLIINIIDNSGRIVSTKTMKISNGNTKIDLEVKSLNKGIYNIEFNFEKEKFKKVEKLIKN